MPRTTIGFAAIAVLLATGCGGSGGGGNGREGRAQAAADAKLEEQCDGPARTAKQLAAELGGKWESLPADQQAVDDVIKDMPPAERVSSRAIVRDGKPVAALIVMESIEGGGTERDLFAGFEEQATGKVEAAKLGGGEARLHRSPDGGASLVGMSDPCTVAMIFGDSPAVTRELAGDLPVEG